MNKIERKMGLWHVIHQKGKIGTGNSQAEMQMTNQYMNRKFNLTLWNPNFKRDTEVFFFFFWDTEFWIQFWNDKWILLSTGKSGMMYLHTCCSWEGKLPIFQKISWPSVSRSLKMVLAFDPIIPLLNIYPKRGIIRVVETASYATIWSVVLFGIEDTKK